MDSKMLMNKCQTEDFLNLMSVGYLAYLVENIWSATFFEYLIGLEDVR